MVGLLHWDGALIGHVFGFCCECPLSIIFFYFASSRHSFLCLLLHWEIWWNFSKKNDLYTYNEQERFSCALSNHVSQPPIFRPQKIAFTSIFDKQTCTTISLRLIFATSRIFLSITCRNKHPFSNFAFSSNMAAIPTRNNTIADHR